MRVLYRAIAVLVICVGGWAIRSAGGDGMDAKYLKESKAFFAHADIYSDNRDYFDWLVEAAHNDVFGDSYSAGIGIRGHSTVDVDRYEDDMIKRTEELARNNDRPEIAESIERLVDPDAAARQKAEKAAKKSNKKK